MRTRLRPNSFIRMAADSTTVLTYAPLTNPLPLTVSLSPTEPRLESLEIAITNGSGADVDVQAITFTIAYGTGADSLTFTTSGIQPSISDIVNWGVNAPVVGTDTVSYTLAPATGTAVTFAAGASVVLQLASISANTVPGTTTVLVAEVTSTASGNTSFELTTFPYGFFFNSLAATVEQGSALVPVAQVAYGSLVGLTWNGSVVETTAYAIFYSTASGGQQKCMPTGQGEWTSPPLTADTVFTVVVTTASVGGGAPLSASLSTAVAVRDPDLVATSLTTSGSLAANGAATFAQAATVGGPLTVDGVAAFAQAANVGGQLTVSGLGQLNGGANVGGSLTVSSTSGLQGDVTANGNLTVAGTVTANANLAVAGTVTAGSATINGDTTINGSVLAGNVTSNFAYATCVWIGGTNPQVPPAPLTVSSAQQQVPFSGIQDQYTIAGYQWNAHSSNETIFQLSDRGQTQFNWVSIFAFGTIVGNSFNTFSDERMKVVDGPSDGAADLETLLGIEITDYRYKSVVADGGARARKVIGQQVERVFPEAVRKHTGVVPDICRVARVVDGWVELSSDLAAGERVKLVSPSGGEGVYDVLEAEPERFRTTFSPDADRVFVFGREVPDVRSVDYDAIAMLNVSATQQLKREKDAEIAALRERLQQLEQRFA